MDVFKIVWVRGIIKCLLAVAAFIGCNSRPSMGETFTDPGFASELVATLPTYGPVGAAWAPDGRMFVWQKNGIVRVVKNGSLLATPFLDFSAKVNTFNDNGMLGMAFDPDFANTGYIFLTYIYEPTGDPNSTASRMGRLVRVKASSANPDVMLTGSETIILDNFPDDNGTHALGTIRFAPDGTMFFAFGDGSDPGSVDLDAAGAQDLNSPRGKFYRINRDGTAATDNPFYDGTDSIRSKVWCYGVRNPYRFSLHPVTGIPYFADVGWNTWEEIDRGVPGGNFGWPCYEGLDPQPLYQSALAQCAQATSVIPPIVTYNHTTGDLNGGGTCIVGGDFYTGNVYPAIYRGNYFYADYSGSWIHRLVLDANGNKVNTAVFATGVSGVITCLEQGPDGLLYYVSLGTGEIRRIKYNGPVAVASATPAYGYSPLGVSFSSAGSLNPGGGSLSYLWDFGDGTTSSAANPSHTYTRSGVGSYTAKLTVSSGGLNSSATVVITVGSMPPSPVISIPIDGSGFMPGQTVTYQGSAIDPDDGALPPSALSWTVLLHHNTHVHAFVEGTGTGGSFVAENHGTVGSFYYEVVLKATDSSGLSASTSVNVVIIEDTTPPSVPAGLTASAANSSRIDLNWTAATDNAAVSGYSVERCQGSGCTAFLPLSTVSTLVFSDTGLLPQTSYTYRVRAIDASGNYGDYSSIATATTLNAPPTDPNLVAAYSFDEGSGSTANDSSGKGNLGTLAGATWTPAGKFGSGLTFNGGFVSVNNSSSLNLSTAMTLEAWVYPTGAGGWRDVIYRINDVYYLEGSSAQGPPALGGTFASEIYGTAPLALSTWSHLAGTYDGSTLRLYLNGVQVASRAQTGLIQTSSGALSIGGDSLYGQYFAGIIDEVRIYNRALSAAEIQADMNTPVSGGGNSNQPPIAAASANPSSGIAPLVVSFSSAGSFDPEGGVLTYNWNFGDGTSSTSANPSHTYSAPGSYLPSLTVSDGVNATTSSSLTITVTAAGNQPPIAAASGSPTSGTVPLAVNFSSAGSSDPEGQPLSYSWTFGDGGSSTSANPSHTYTAVGTYTVQLTVSDGVNSTTSTSVTIIVSSGNGLPGLVAAYSFNEGAGTTTTDSSGNGNTGTITAATWLSTGKFGNALSFNGTSARVTINDSASLHLSTGMTLEAWVYPTVSGGWRDVIYKINDVYYLEGSSTQNSSPALGGTFASAQVYGTSALPLNAWSHVAGTYDGTTMRLYLNGTQVASRNQTGAIGSSASPLSIGGNSLYEQYFGGRIDEVRIYNRALSLTEIQTDMNTPVGGGGAVNQPPVASASANPISGAAPLAVAFSSAGSSDPEGQPLTYTWSFGDGITSTAANPSHTYSSAGSYSASLSVSDEVNTTTSSSIAITVSALANQPPIASASANPTSGSAPLTVNFSSAGSSDPEGQPLTYNWAFGDGTSSTAANPSHVYSAGSYVATLTVSDGVNSRTSSGINITAAGGGPTGLVAAYSFNAGSGTTVADGSGNGNNGTITAATWITTGKFGNALSFNGTSARVTINDSPSLHLSTGMTLEAWVYPTASGKWRDVIYKINDVYYLESSSSQSSRPAAGGTFANPEVFGTAALALNTWSHLAATYDGATLRLYVNGTQVDSRAQTGTIQSSTSALSIGGDSLYGQYFAGRIDEVRIYNRALSAAEIQTDMNTALP
jgi:PKD repeat protein